MKRLIAMLCATGLVACAHVDTGQIDYRVAEAAPSGVDIEAKIDACKADASKCGPLTNSPLIRKYVGNHTAITKDEVYSVELEQAVIGSNLLEGHFFGQQLGKRGEFAILANAFEFIDGQQAKRFIEVPEYTGKSDKEDDIELKLVYFGDDIAKMQPFNFSSIPLMQRAVYNGGSVGIQIVVMEVDARSSPVTSLLETLAKFGQRTTPGAPDVTSMLFKLGESLLQGSQDDRLFDYRFVLSSGAAIDSEGKLGPIAAFAPGRYIFWRAQQREAPLDWKRFLFDYNTGRLHDHQGNEVRNEMYLVVNIRRYPKGTRSETYTQAAWSTFRATVQQAADARGAPIAALTNDLNKVLAYERSSNWKTLLMDGWHDAEGKLRQLSARTISNVGPISSSGCDATKALLARDLADQAAQDALRKFLADYQAAGAASVGTGEKGESEFKLDDREELISLVARYFMPWKDDQVKGYFSNSASFDKSFIADGATAQLPKLSVETAATRGLVVTDCQSLQQLAGSWR